MIEKGCCASDPTFFSSAKVFFSAYTTPQLYLWSRFCCTSSSMFECYTLVRLVVGFQSTLESAHHMHNRSTTYRNSAAMMTQTTSQAYLASALRIFNVPAYLHTIIGYRRVTPTSSPSFPKDISLLLVQRQHAARHYIYLPRDPISSSSTVSIRSYRMAKQRQLISFILPA
jgi:hypothetical protein